MSGAALSYLADCRDNIGNALGGGTLARAFRDIRAAGIEAEGCTDTDLMLWEKFLLIAGTSAATSVTRCTVGAVRSDPDMRWLLCEAIAEAERIGRAAGVCLASNILDQVMEALDANPADGKSSQSADLGNGRRLELEGLRGQSFGSAKNWESPLPFTQPFMRR